MCKCNLLTRDGSATCHSRGCPDMPMPSRSIDRQVITDGMRVWNYDLNRGTVDLTDRHQEWADGDVWFDVIADGCERGSSFNGTRVWVRHPTTGALA